MKNILVLLVLAALGWHAHGKYKATASPHLRAGFSYADTTTAINQSAATPAPAHFACDGRTHCSQ